MSGNTGGREKLREKCNRRLNAKFAKSRRHKGFPYWSRKFFDPLRLNVFREAGVNTIGWMGRDTFFDAFSYLWSFDCSLRIVRYNHLDDSEFGVRNDWRKFFQYRRHKQNISANGMRTDLCWCVLAEQTYRKTLSIGSAGTYRSCCIEVSRKQKHFAPILHLVQLEKLSIHRIDEKRGYERG